MIVLGFILLTSAIVSIAGIIIRKNNAYKREMAMLRRREIELRKELEIQHQNNLQEEKMFDFLRKISSR